MSISLPTWYAIGLASFISTLILYRRASLLHHIYSLAEFAFLRFIVYHPLIFYTLIVALFLGLNLVTLSLKATVDQVALRSAIVAIANLIFLLPSPIHRMTNLYGSSLFMQMFLHQCFGWAMIGHGLIHTIIHLTILNSRPIMLKEQMVFGIMTTSVSCSIGLLCGLFYAAIGYEFFVGSHQVLAPGLLAGLWFHIPRGRNISTLLLGISSVVWVVSKLVQLFITLWSWGTTVSIQGRYERCFALQLKQTQPRSFQDGQYFHLIVPQVGWFGWSGLFEHHPFVVLRGKESSESHILITPRSGFTQQLLRLGHNVPAFLDGPFGSPINFREYGAVVMFATGLGIVSHMAYINAILIDHQKCRNKTRHISVHWLPDSPTERDVVGSGMDNLLMLDYEEGSTRYGLGSEQTCHNKIKQYLLNITIYGCEQDEMAKGRNRIQQRCHGPDVEKILSDELNANNACKIAVVVSASYDFRGQVIEKFRKKMNVGSRLFCVDFQPSRKVSLDKPDRLSFQCAGVDKF